MAVLEERFFDEFSSQSGTFWATTTGANLGDESDATYVETTTTPNTTFSGNWYDGELHATYQHKIVTITSIEIRMRVSLFNTSNDPWSVRAYIVDADGLPIGTDPVPAYVALTPGNTAWQDLTFTIPMSQGSFNPTCKVEVVSSRSGGSDSAKLRIARLSHVTTYTADTTAPTAPTNLVTGAINTTARTVALDWADSATTDNRPGIEYYIERAPDVSGAPGTYAVVHQKFDYDAGGSSHTDTVPAGPGAVWYRVQAKDRAFNASGYSNAVKATLAAGPTTTPVSATATAVATPTATRTATFPRSVASTAVATPTVTVARRTSASVSTTAVATPTATRTATFPRSVASTAVATPTATRTASLARAAASTAVAAPTVTLSKSAGTSVSTTAVATPTATRTASLTRPATATAVATPTATRTASLARAAASTAVGTPTATRTATFPRSVMSTAVATPATSATLVAPSRRPAWWRPMPWILEN